MVTFVSKVFVSNGNNSALATAPASIKKGQFIVYDVDAAKYTIDADTKRFKIGMGSGKSVKDHKGVSHPEIKWSNIIQADDIRSINVLAYKADTEEAVKIDFTKINAAVLKLLAVGGKRIIVRLTFKDLPTRFRKWTESYEYVTLPGDTAATISKNIADLINKQWKRARVVATDAAGVITLTAMPYDDDDSVDTLNVANKVRFNANVYYTDPAAEGWESLNKHYPTGVTIEKTPGTQYAASAKLVRDREAWSMGYDGILNRGEGTWPIIKPAMETKLDGQYNAINIEFENAYRAADDIVRKTKQNVEIYTTGATSIITDLIAKIGTSEAASVTTHNNGD
ncbi:hypothetical protein KNV62_gp24 [uncultured phage cr273_1]|uniref:Uncharacterized protein n=1 Tax=uncultured phage cr273_1 TaxID=2772095 RepID=A0A7M1RTZ6_9CAUD|nr:hypothetical protein KNV62_gp24 [uncultured phage cr273_1]QOR57927.1 hypothetical protein [uncultured phage cr273_1]